MLDARELARSYDRSVAAAWRGEDQSSALFMDWLSTFWSDALPEPITDPVATSSLGASGRGICWYETADAILGYVRGLDRPICYRVPRTSKVPELNLPPCGAGAVKRSPATTSRALSSIPGQLHYAKDSEFLAP